MSRVRLVAGGALMVAPASASPRPWRSAWGTTSGFTTFSTNFTSTGSGSTTNFLVKAPITSTKMPMRTYRIDDVKSAAAQLPETCSTSP
jgi:hypothetical protein